MGADVSLMFTVTVPTSNPRRNLRVFYNSTNGVPIPPGRYRVVVAEDDIMSIDDTATDVSIIPYEYYFNVTLDCSLNSTPGANDFLSGTHNPAADCDRNGVDDDCDLAYDSSFRDVVPPGGNDILDTCEVNPDCPCDFNDDDYLNSQDFFDFITCFFDTDPIGCGADFNGDDVVNSQDFFDWILCFFSGC